MTNKEKLYLAKVAGAVAGAGEGALIGDLGVPGEDEVAGAGLGAAIGLGGMPIEVSLAQRLAKAKKNLKLSTKELNDKTLSAATNKRIWGPQVKKWTGKVSELDAKVPNYMKEPVKPPSVSTTPKYQSGLDDKGFEMYRSTPEG